MGEFEAWPAVRVPVEQSFWQRRLLEECNHSRRYNQSFVLILFAIAAGDGECGAPLGPETIDLVGDSLRAGVRAGDAVVRVGPARFAILLLDSKPEFARAIAERLVLHVREDTGSLVRGLQSARLQCGVAAYGPERPAPEDLVAAAEADLVMQLTEGGAAPAA